MQRDVRLRLSDVVCPAHSLLPTLELERFDCCFQTRRILASGPSINPLEGDRSYRVAL
jgi:hypothetical protein